MHVCFRYQFRCTVYSWFCISIHQFVIYLSLYISIIIQSHNSSFIDNIFKVAGVLHNLLFRTMSWILHIDQSDPSFESIKTVVISSIKFKKRTILCMSVTIIMHVSNLRGRQMPVQIPDQKCRQSSANQVSTSKPDRSFTSRQLLRWAVTVQPWRTAVRLASEKAVSSQTDKPGVTIVPWPKPFAWW